MKKALKIIGSIVLLLVAFVLIAGLFVAKDYHFETSVAINAPKEKVWQYAGSLHGMEKWSPFIESDPDIQVSFEGQDSAVGAIYTWKGNKEVGSGSQTISKIDPLNRMDTHLHFIEPFEGEADAYLKLSGEGNATNVAWGFNTRYKYPMNVMLLFINMDKMMGESFNKGLAKLKQLSEAG
jgi:hypothetical protein